MPGDKDLLNTSFISNENFSDEEETQARENERAVILNWYNALEQTLKNSEEAYHLDLNKPTDLLSIKAYDLRPAPDKEDDEYVAIPEQKEGESYYAFIPQNYEDGTFQGYQTQPPMPHYPGADKQQEVVTAFLKTKSAFSSYAGIGFQLKEAYKKNQSPQVIAELEKKKEAALRQIRECDQGYVNKCREVYQELNQWTISQQRKFDPEKDFEQIKNLYDKAEKGLLYIEPQKLSNTGKIQICVDDNGAPALVKQHADSGQLAHRGLSDLIVKMKNNQPLLQDEEKYRGVISAHLAEFERENGTIEQFRTPRTKVPPEPEAVPAPGVRSWLKRIFSFNRIKDDFTRYETYQAEKRNYEAQKEARKREVEACRTANIENQKRLTAFVDRYAGELGFKAAQNISNIGEISNNLVDAGHVETNLGQAGDALKNGILPETVPADISMQIYRHIEAHENPDSYNPDGSVNREASEKYWKEKGPLLDDETLAGINKTENKLAELKEQWQKRQKDLAEIKQNVQTKETALDVADSKQRREDRLIAAQKKVIMPKLEEHKALIRQGKRDLENCGFRIENAEKTWNTWAKDNYWNTIKNLGRLFSDEAHCKEYGVAAMRAIICRNREYTYPESEYPFISKEVPFKERRTSSEVLQDLETLIEVANHPTEENKAKHAKLIQEIDAKMQQPDFLKDYPASVFVDSACDVITAARFLKGAEINNVTPALAVCSQFAASIAKNHNTWYGTSLSDAFFTDLHCITTKEQRESALDFANKCTTVGKTLKTLKKQTAVLTETAKQIPDTVPDLAVKRKQELNLADTTPKQKKHRSLA